MEKEAVHFTVAEMNNLINKDVVIQFIHNPANRDEDYIGLNGKITGFQVGDNPPNIVRSIDFEPTEQSAFNAEVGGIDLPENISIIRVRMIKF